MSPFESSQQRWHARTPQLLQLEWGCEVAVSDFSLVHHSPEQSGSATAPKELEHPLLLVEWDCNVTNDSAHEKKIIRCTRWVCYSRPFIQSFHTRIHTCVSHWRWGFRLGNVQNNVYRRRIEDEHTQPHTYTCTSFTGKPKACMYVCMDAGCFYSENG